MTDSSYTQTGHSGGDTITAFFDSRGEADNALARLREVGIAESSLRLTGADGGAGTGGAAGEDKGFFASLGDLFFPDEDRHAYEEGIRRGGYLVSVTGVSAAQREEAFDVLESAGAVDFDEREQSWRAEGWTGGTGTAGATQGYGTGYGSGATSRAAEPGFAEDRGSFEAAAPAAGADEETLPVVEENLRVGKRDSSHGRVRIRSYVREVPVSEEVTLRDDRVEVERRPVDRAAVADDDFRERSIEAEEHTEEAVVSKDARVVEEVALRRDAGTHTETVSDTVRHTDVEVERDDDTGERR